MRDWSKIRVYLYALDPQSVLDGVVAVGKVEADELPGDVADRVLALFDHPDAQVRAEAVRALGVHWRLRRALNPIAEIVNRDDDASVQLYAIGALGIIGYEHPDLRCFASKALAGIVLNGKFGDYQRMVAYVELLRVEGRIDFKEYMRRDRDIPARLEVFEIDRPWVEELANQDCSRASGSGERQ